MVLVALAAGPLLAQSPGNDLERLAAGIEPRVERYAPEGRPPVEIRFLLQPDAAGQAARVVDITLAALRRFDDWFGPYPFDRLTVIDAPWPSSFAGAAYPGVVVTSTRWLAPARDRSLERTLIGAIARQYWFPKGDSEPAAAWFAEGLTLYTGTRAIHEALEGRNFETPHFFGDFVPFPIRSVPLSRLTTDPRPPVRHFPEIEATPSAPWRFSTTSAGGQAQRAALVLHTLERYMGWPALQQALAAYRARAESGAAGPAGLGAVVSEQRGRDLEWFFGDAFRAEAPFDFSVEGLTSERAAADASTFETRVGLLRLGDGVFAGTRWLPVTVAFEDGSQVREQWDVRVAQQELVYISASRAVSATVDPGALLLIDADRSNNTRALRQPVDVVGARLALNWLVWLQDLMLSCTALA